MRRVCALLPFARGCAYVCVCVCLEVGAEILLRRWTVSHRKYLGWFMRTMSCVTKSPEPEGAEQPPSGLGVWGFRGFGFRGLGFRV